MVSPKLCGKLVKIRKFCRIGVLRRIEFAVCSELIKVNEVFRRRNSLLENFSVGFISGTIIFLQLYYFILFLVKRAS